MTGERRIERLGDSVGDLNNKYIWYVFEEHIVFLEMHTLVGMTLQRVFAYDSQSSRSYEYIHGTLVFLEMHTLLRMTLQRVFAYDSQSSRSYESTWNTLCSWKYILRY